MKNDQAGSNQPPHAPGAGSDKQHPETPSDANERFKKQEKEEQGK